MNQIVEYTGRALYWVLFPFILVIFRKSRRVYAVIQFDDKVLVVKNWIGSGAWVYPGGGMKRSEKPEDALIREIFEELAIRLNPEQLTLRLDWQRYPKGFYYRHYNVQLKKLPTVKRQYLEIFDYKWVKNKDVEVILKNM